MTRFELGKERLRQGNAANDLDDGNTELILRECEADGRRVKLNQYRLGDAMLRAYVCPVLVLSSATACGRQFVVTNCRWQLVVQGS